MGFPLEPPWLSGSDATAGCLGAAINLGPMEPGIPGEINTKDQEMVNG